MPTLSPTSSSVSHSSEELSFSEMSVRLRNESTKQRRFLHNTSSSFHVITNS